MNALTVMGVVNVAPPAATVPSGPLVFPVPPLVAWLVVVGLLAASCVVLAALTTYWAARPPRAHGLTPRRLWPWRRHPQPS